LNANIVDEFDPRESMVVKLGSQVGHLALSAATGEGGRREQAERQSGESRVEQQISSHGYLLVSGKRRRAT